MHPPRHYVPIPNSERTLLADARLTGSAAGDQIIKVTIYVRRNPSTEEMLDVDQLGAQFPQERRYLSNAEFRRFYGADQNDLDQVATFARAHGLEVLGESVHRRNVLLSGTIRKMQTTFGVELNNYVMPSGTFRLRTGAVYIPPDLAHIVEAVFGLDNRRTGLPRLRRAPHSPIALELTRLAEGAASRLLPPGTYFPPAVAQLYRYPRSFDGRGQCIAILAFNGPDHGGYRIEALRTYFETLLRSNTPEITDIVVHGPGNDPGSDSSAAQMRGDSSGEIMLDIEVAGSVAPGATLAIYFTEFTEQGWVDAVNTIITDTANDPSVVSISYGNPEDDPRSAWTTMAILKVNEAFRAAAARGITVCCASGDDGSRDQGGGPRAHADFPASSPYVLGCGGTRVRASGNTITSEVVWNDGPGSATGGGVSRIFSLPTWQANANVPTSANPDHKIGRGVPDVSVVGDPATGVAVITLDGMHLAILGGTSVGAPLWSALIARLNQGLGARVGYFNPLLYTRLGDGVLRDIVQGDNGTYQAGPGWDACTGLGSPNGVKLLGALRNQAGGDDRSSERKLRERIEVAYQSLIASFSQSWTRLDARDIVEMSYQRYLDALAGMSEPLYGAQNFQSSAQASSDYMRTLLWALSPAIADQPVRVAYEDFLQTLQEEWANADLESLDVMSLLSVTQLMNAAAAQTAAAFAYVRQRWMMITWWFNSSK
jgi:kumamolisin